MQVKNWNINLIMSLILFSSILLVSACASESSRAAGAPSATVAAVAVTPISPSPTAEVPPTQDSAAEVTPTPTVVMPSATPASTVASSTPTPPVERPALDSLEIKLNPVASGFTKPLYLTHAGDGTGRLFVVEQAGRILILEDGVVNPTPFLDIISIVGSSANEQGLLSVAFHPDYANNGFLFVNYTDKQGDTVIARYQVSPDDPGVVDPNSAQILLMIDQPYANHNGGQLAFGPDGYLYIGMGDGGAANDPENRAQSLDTLLGKILRIDVNGAEPYGIPETNPFANDPTARPEIWSYGWRNPWRFSFDQATSDLYIADVGQNQYEEIHVERAGTAGGQNYGWRIMEGFHCFRPADCDPEAQGLVLPVVEYDHSLGCSVTGGYVYRGEQYPGLQGTYFYGDYCSGIIWGLRDEGNGTWAQAELLRTEETISSFGQDETGELYLIDHSGEIFQLGN